MNNSLENIKLVLSKSFDFESANTADLAAFMELLAEKVQYEMSYNLEHFFSLLYRLDIDEQKIKNAIHTQVDVPTKIAVLIYERQLEKLAARKQFPSQSIDDDMSW
jgi:predicted metallopeptidase